MLILAIDPGPRRSAWVVLDGVQPNCFAHETNEAVLRRVRGQMGIAWVQADDLGIEMIASYGMPVGADVFETCLWIGRFLEAWDGEYSLIYRRDVKLGLCGSARAKDPNVRQAIIDRYPLTGGGRVPQIGTKKKPGPLYGIKGDVWAALGVALTLRERLETANA